MEDVANSYVIPTQATSIHMLCIQSSEDSWDHISVFHSVFYFLSVDFFFKASLKIFKTYFHR